MNCKSRLLCFCDYGLAWCGIFAVVGILCTSLELSTPVTFADDPYQCACTDGALTQQEIFGGVECQHGPEQDIDCIVWRLVNQTPGYTCTDNGENAPNPLPTFAQLPMDKQQVLIDAGFDPADEDGKCECYRCVDKADITNWDPSPCEGLLTDYGAYCEKDKTGDCETEADMNGVQQTETPMRLKAMKNACSDSGEESGSGDGSGIGTNVATFCGGIRPGGDGPVNIPTGANCISDDCEADPTMQPQTIKEGPLYKCKTM